MADYDSDTSSLVAQPLRGGPDYPLDETLELTDPAQYRALFEETRRHIVSLLLERAATTSELAQALDRPKGTIGHHLKVLERAGLVRVVRTKQVRALTAKYYGRTARVFLFQHRFDAVGEPQRILARAAAEIAERPSYDADAAGSDDGSMTMANLRYARIPHQRAAEWADRVQRLLVEFSGEPADGDTTYALVVGVYPTSRKPLPDDADEPPAPKRRTTRSGASKDAAAADRGARRTSKRS